MAESNVYPSEEDFFYFCFDCRNTLKETEKEFLYVGALGPCYTCNLCRQEFEAGFKREKIKLDKTKMPSCSCAVCGKTFGRSDTLLHHSYQHSKQWPYQCSFCQKGFAIHSLLKKHERKRNTVREIQCNKCFKYFLGKICFALQSGAYCEECSNGPYPTEYVAS
ncbi:hypothetical protein TNIN_420631 [Trichonephila inaurata madagascariensis]|uniref:C2H2-type domain-containing protein n=1 Tax=Trichonephila inaurata madagascariensis TaxID=2747483 RepID=A0A8X6ML80_9ARAC|nr:hypothetical protein TNIN_420631 [Trichonephila inaurata madagascariensis]